jgi:2-oxoglutarate dehydrogenase E1 component
MVGLGKTTLKKIIDHLRSAYCNTIGAEYMYILEPEIRNWIKEKLEKRNLNLPLKKKKRILEN